jgi:hypothetical protein
MQGLSAQGSRITAGTVGVGGTGQRGGEKGGSTPGLTKGEKLIKLVVEQTILAEKVKR